jgi:hypothetical protein
MVVFDAGHELVDTFRLTLDRGFVTYNTYKSIQAPYSRIEGYGMKASIPAFHRLR